MSSSTGSLENEYSYVWKCSPTLWFIMDEGALYGCHNSVLSTACSPTAPLRGSSQFIIDHPSSPHLLHSAQHERMRMRKNNKRNIETKRGHEGFLSNLFIVFHFLSCYHCWSSLLPFPFFPSLFCVCECMVIRQEVSLTFWLLTYHCRDILPCNWNFRNFQLWIWLKDYIVFWCKNLVDETIWKPIVQKDSKNVWWSVSFIVLRTCWRCKVTVTPGSILAKLKNILIYSYGSSCSGRTSHVKYLLNK